jgi:5-(carboxyamino)imidazole ribonucleotide mutase
MSEKKWLVAVVMGSESDWETMERTHKTLAQFAIPHTCRVLSAHRTPKELEIFVQQAVENGVEVFIAGAGLAAALPGCVAAMTTVPVLGVPIQTGAFEGHDALMAIVQMPPGIPVGAVAVGKVGATNAALMAVAILANKYPEHAGRLKDFRAEQAKKVLDTKLPCE